MLDTVRDLRNLLEGLDGKTKIQFNSKHSEYKATGTYRLITEYSPEEAGHLDSQVIIFIDRK